MKVWAYMPGQVVIFSMEPKAITLTGTNGEKVPVVKGGHTLHLSDFKFRMFFGNAPPTFPDIDEYDLSGEGPEFVQTFRLEERDEHRQGGEMKITEATLNTMRKAMIAHLVTMEEADFDAMCEELKGDIVPGEITVNGITYSAAATDLALRLLRENVGKLVGKCKCGKPGHWQKDPYMDEIHDEAVWGFMCPDCYHDSCMDT